MDPIYGYQAVNVEAQLREPASLLNWTRRMLAVRKTFGAFGRGSLTFLRPGNRKILAYLRIWDDEILLCVANLARSAQPVELDLSRFKGRVPVELVGRTAFPPIGELPYLLTLTGYGFLWFRLAAGKDVPAWHEERLPRDDLPVLVLFDGWASLFRDRVVPWRIAMSEKVRAQLEREVLPTFIASRRWFAGKGQSVRRVELADHAEWKPGTRNWLITLARVESDQGDTQTYFLPLTLAWEDHDDEMLRTLGPLTVAKARQQAQVGVIGDAFGDEAFCRALVSGVGTGVTLKTQRGALRFEPTRAFAAFASADIAKLTVSMPGGQSSNTIVALGDRLFLKGYRRVSVGLNPEVEIGRFLTDAGFAHAVPVVGSVEYGSDDGRSATLAIVQAYVSNQGDGWAYTLDYLDRFFDALPRETEGLSNASDVHGGYLALARTLGTRTAELHRTFARSTGDAAFDPEPVKVNDVAAWTRHLHDEAVAVLERLGRRRDALPAAARADVDDLLARRDALLARIRRHASDTTTGAKTRLHGDYHLGQVLIAQNDFIITDFEGEPARPLDERRQKHSPLKDVAGMLRSFDYAMHAALFDALTERPGSHDQVIRAARQWQAEARQAFLEAYDEVARKSGLASPSGERSGLLELFVLEKAIYELRYEIDNRPDWVRIPLRGLVEALEVLP
jgi:maltose alpha-D-glucosyltransferase/alpha-amylase